MLVIVKITQPVQMSPRNLQTWANNWNSTIWGKLGTLAIGCYPIGQVARYIGCTKYN